MHNLKFVLLVILVLTGVKVLQGLVVAGGELIIIAYLTPFILAFGFFAVVCALERMEERNKTKGGD